MNRVLTIAVVVLICALLLAIGLPLVVEQPTWGHALVAGFCGSVVVALATARWPQIAAIASSVGGLCALTGCAMSLVSLVEAPSKEDALLALGAALFGVSGLHYARRVWFGALPALQK
jgi:cell division protein FtsW (lipid II flippase)